MWSSQKQNFKIMCLFHLVVHQSQDYHLAKFNSYKVHVHENTIYMFIRKLILQESLDQHDFTIHWNVPNIHVHVHLLISNLTYMYMYSSILSITYMQYHLSKYTCRFKSELILNLTNIYIHKRCSEEEIWITNIPTKWIRDYTKMQSKVSWQG